MTFNSSQQERLLAALERIADALEKQAPVAGNHPEPPPATVNALEAFVKNYEAGVIRRTTDPHSTKGPYR